MTTNCIVFAAGVIVGYLLVCRLFKKKYMAKAAQALAALRHPRRTTDSHDYQQTVDDMLRFISKRKALLNKQELPKNADDSLPITSETRHYIECFVRYAHRSGCEVSLRSYKEVEGMNYRKKNVYITNLAGIDTARSRVSKTIKEV